MSQEVCQNQCLCERKHETFRENDIFPVEVKSEANTTSKNLKKFKELFPNQVKLRVQFSLDNLKLDDDVLNIPLFMADQTDRLIGLALEHSFEG